MEAEDLIPLAKRLEKINKAIEIYERLGKVISDYPDEEIEIWVSSPNDNEETSPNQHGFPPLPGIMTFMQHREEKPKFKISFEDIFALEIIGALLHTLNHEREYIIEQMGKYNE